MSSKTHHRGLPALVAAAVAALAGSAAFGQTTQPVTWVDTTTNDYNNAASWSSNQTPLNASHEFLQINNGGTATLSGSANYEGAWLNLGVHPGESGHLQIDGGTLTLG